MVLTTNSSSYLSLKEQGKTCSFYLVARFGSKRAKLPLYHRFAYFVNSKFAQNFYNLDPEI